MPPATADRRQAVAIAAAPTVFVLLWSTGFVGAKYGLPYAPPFLFLALRLLIAGVLLVGIAVATGAPRLTTASHVGRSAISGLLLHAGYLGGVFWAIAHGFPAGVASVVVSLQPVLVAALAGTVLDEHLRRIQWVGLVLGVVGVVLVLAPGLGGGIPVAGVVSCLVSLLAGTLGTLHQKRHGDGIPLVWGTAMQYAAAAVVLAIAAVATEPLHISWSGRFVAALAWLVLALSLGAILLLLVLLRRGSAAGVSSLFYLVPPATAVEAYFLFGETLSPVSLVGIVVATVGVALVVSRARQTSASRRGLRGRRT